LIDSENLGPNHIVSIAAKRFLDRFSPFSKATVAAKQACVDQFDQRGQTHCGYTEKSNTDKYTASD